MVLEEYWSINTLDDLTVGKTLTIDEYPTSNNPNYAFTQLNDFSGLYPDQNYLLCLRNINILAPVWATGYIIKYIEYDSTSYFKIKTCLLTGLRKRKVASLDLLFFPPACWIARDAAKQNCYIILPGDATACSHTQTSHHIFQQKPGHKSKPRRWYNIYCNKKGSNERANKLLGKQHPPPTTLWIIMWYKTLKTKPELLLLFLN